MTVVHKLNHVLVMPIGETSHLRQVLHLTINLMEAHPSVIVSIIFGSSMRTKFDKEAEQILRVKQGATADLQRWRVVEIHDGIQDGERKSLGGMLDRIEAFVACSEPTLKGLINASEGGRWSVRPCLVICDFFLGSIRTLVRSLCESTGSAMIPVVPFLSTMALTAHRNVNDTALHGVCEGAMQRYKQNLQSEMEDFEASRKAFRFVQNARLEWPDLPPMYDYEHTPQSENRIIDPSHCLLLDYIWRILHNADGFICVSVPEIDGQSLKVVSSKLGVPMVGVGPQLGPNAWTPLVNINTDHPVFEFLDNALERFGARSVVYISFGTIIWPTLRPSLMEEMVDTLLEKDIPFVFSTPSLDGKVSDMTKKKVQESGMGMILDWVPQLEVLQHQATAAFITHCGMGSLTEAIVSETPIIAVPFTSDGPALAAHFTQIQRIGVQLDQISANPGMTLANGSIVVDTPEARRDELVKSIEMMRGANGEVFRHRLRELKALMQKSKDDGGARQGLLSIAQWFT